ncbi:DUF485 domain-containing protein [Chrysiogenes arsenatis]|uniref:DUF485 domain-containing protein n=1 Tax=Chrysiogenes arsenatis TaxID=309797 RepID=UPI000406B92B|nr:DUF485 domain-containing protein [Chrysiogenes arsenatis]
MLESEVVAKIQKNPKYKELVDMRNRFGIVLTLIMLAVYYGFIMVIAFKKDILAIKLGAGVMSIGIPIGIGIIIFTILITGFYVLRANGKFDELNEEILREVK